MTPRARTATGLLALAAASLGLTALRYGRETDADDRFQAALAARLADADMLLVGVEETPALRVLHLRRIGCEAGWRVVFAPDDGEAEHAIARLAPGAPTARRPSAHPLRPGWILAADVGAGACLAPAEAAALLSDTNG